MLEVQLADIWWCVRCVARGAWCAGCVVFAHILSCSMLEVQRAVRGARLRGTRCAARGARAWCVEEPLPVWREFRRRRPVCRWHRLLACCSQQGLIRPVLSGEGKGGERDGGVGEGEGEWRGGARGGPHAIFDPQCAPQSASVCLSLPTVQPPFPALTAHPRASCPVQLRPALCAFIRPDFSPVLPRLLPADILGFLFPCLSL